MIPFLANPLGLLGLAALPLLVGIYLLRRRHRRLPVSALFLWNHALPPRQGGTRVHPARLPWLFLLELAILTLLALAAADPLIPRRDANRNLLIVLDATIAMRAPGKDGTPAVELARQRLRREFRAEPWRRIRVIEARAQPVMRVDATTVAEATAQLEAFRAHEPQRDIAPALALANRLAGPADALLVLTDRPPAEPPTDPRLRWIAVGASRPNLAIVAALRGSAADGSEICRIEIANFSDSRQTATLLLETENGEEGEARTQPQAVTLAPGARQALRVPAPRPDVPLRLRLEPGDDFMLDSVVDLGPDPETPLSVAVALDPESAPAHWLHRALRAADRARLLDPASPDRSGPPALTFREPAPDPVAYAAWTVVWHRPAQARALRGPFLRGSPHPLTEELALDGVWWGAQPSYALPGRPLLSLADGTPLLAVSDGPVLHMQWNPELSTLQHTPDWPILIDNLLTWRARTLPAGQPRNLALGGRIHWQSPGSAPATVHHPDGSRTTLDPHENTMVFRPAEPGRYRIVLPDGEPLHVSVNLLNATTSDLRGRGAGEWGHRFSPTGRAMSQVSIAWLLLLAALALCAAHAGLATKGGTA